jgi:hypothetical protein
VACGELLLFWFIGLPVRARGDGTVGALSFLVAPDLAVEL